MTTEQENFNKRMKKVAEISAEVTRRTTFSIKDFAAVVNEAAEKMHQLAVEAANEETPCPIREDKIHCVCWYDGKACCGCGDNPIHLCEKGCGCDD